MIRRLITSAAGLALAAWGQGSIENWAVSADLNSAQLGSVLSTLNQPIANRPFSATAVVRKTHALEGGIHIDHTTTAKMYRDAQGRRRSDTDRVIDISDPVARAGLELDSALKLAVKRTEGAYVIPEEKLQSIRNRADQDNIVSVEKRGGRRGPNAPHRETLRENLGVQTINGVLAYGVRTTVTIPAGEIGNDRDIKATKETWTSSDLHILVRSIDSDPRYGTSTYELTNIVQAAPDPALFRLDVPSGYTVRSQQQGFQAQIVR